MKEKYLHSRITLSLSEGVSYNELLQTLKANFIKRKNNFEYILQIQNSNIKNLYRIKIVGKSRVLINCLRLYMMI